MQIKISLHFLKAGTANNPPQQVLHVRRHVLLSSEISRYQQSSVEEIIPWVSRVASLSKLKCNNFLLRNNCKAGNLATSKQLIRLQPLHFKRWGY